MTHVHYKFSSKLGYDTVVLDGPHITLGELKRQIMCREKLRAGDCDLQITNAQTKEEYTEDEGPIPKGSSVIVRRIPTRGGKSSSSSKTTKIERSVSQSHHSFDVAKAMDDHTPSTLHFFSKMANLADADASEEDKIKVMLNQSIYDSMNYNKKFGSALPANYTCYRCGNTGHHIRNCPSSGDKNFDAPLKIKKSTGIPRSFMVEVDDPNTKGAMLTNCGRYAIPAIDAEAYAVGKKERPPFVPQEKPISEPEEDPVPDELLCLICHELLSDAVVIPCCGNSYCDDCIRSTLLDSEEHVCPTCGQQNVSPDTLIANKFLRQAVNNFKKERGYTKSKTGICDSSQSQNPTPAPSPVPTPPLTVQSQPQKQHQSSCSQQAADIQPLLENPPAAAAGPTSDTSDGNMFTTSLQAEQSCLDIPDKEAEEEAQDDSAAAAEDEDAAAAAPPAAADAVVAPPPAVIADDDPTAPPSQLIPVVNETTVAEQPQSDQQQSSSGPAPGSSSCWQSSSASSGCPTGGWTESQQLTPSPSLTYSATAPPLFPSPLYHPYLSAHHSHSSYPPGYPPPPPIWTLPCPQGAPIPSLCSSTPTPSIPALIPKEWYRYQRKKERSPDRGSTYRRSSSRSYAASSKSKSSRSYSRSSSRSRSRSRSKSQGKSRPRSPYSRHRALHTSSHPSYNYGYKRSPTPSSSSSPQVGHHSRAKSPSDHRKNRHHGHHHHHHTRKSASSGSSSTRRGERSKREEGRHGGRSTSLQVTQSSSVDLDRERHLQWNKQYNEWCEKYFSSYINHFHQLPLSFINLPPPPQFDGSKYYLHADSDSRHRPSALMDDHSRSSTDSRSPPSHSSSSSRSTPSQSSSDSCSSPSNTPDGSRSPPSQMSCNGRLTQSEDWTERREYRQHKNGHSPVRKGSEEEEELQDRSKDGKKEMTGNLEDHRSINSEQRETKKHEEGRGEESSSPRASNSTGDSRKDERRHITGPHSISVWDEATFRPHKSLDEDCERKSKENRDLEEKKRRIRGKDSKSRHNVSRQHKTKSSKRDDTEYRNPGGSKAPDFSSVGDRKTKVETPEKRETHESKSPNPFEKKRQKSEQKKQSKTSPLWEGRITVKPPKKISININLDGKWKEGKTEDQQNITGKPKGEMEAERNFKTEETVEVNDKNESGRREGAAFEDKIKPEGGDSKDLRQRAAVRDDKRVMWTNTGREEGNIVENKEDGEDADFALWHFEEELARDDGRRLTAKEEEEGAVREENEGQERANRGNLPGKWKAVEVIAEGRKRRMREEEDDEIRFKTQRSSNEGPGSNIETDSSSTGDCQETRTMVKRLEEFIQDKDGESEDQLALIQAPPSKWKKEEFEEEEQIDRDVKSQEPFPAGPPPPLLVTQRNMETEGENEVLRQRSVDTKRDEDRAMQKGRGENEKPLTLFTLDRFVAPSSGKITADSTLYSDRERGRTTEVAKCRDRERGRDSERSRDRQRETKRTKGEGRDRSRERRHHKKSLPSSSHSSPYSTSQDVERRDRQRRDDRGKSPRPLNPADKISTSRTTEVPDKRRTTADRDRKPKHRDYHDHRNATGNRAAGSHSSSPSLSHRKHRHPDLKLLLKRSRDGNKDEKEEWKSNEVMRESKEERETKKIEAERVSGGPYKSTAERWEGGGVVVEEGERPSSSSSSSSSNSSSNSSNSSNSSSSSNSNSSSSSPASQESSKYDGRKERKKSPKTERREKNEAAVELLEERELQEHGHKKKSKRGEDEREAESRGDSRWREEDDHTELCSVLLL